MNQILGLFPSETAEPAMCLPEDELKEVLCHAMPFNYPNHTVIDLIQFAERLESLQPNENKNPAEPKKVNTLNTEKPSICSLSNEKPTKKLHDLENQRTDLAPIAFGVIQNPNKVRARSTVIYVRRVHKNKTVKILFDSRASASIISHSYVHRNNFSTKSMTYEWASYGRNVQYMLRGQC